MSDPQDRSVSGATGGASPATPPVAPPPPQGPPPSPPPPPPPSGTEDAEEEGPESTGDEGSDDTPQPPQVDEASLPARYSAPAMLTGAVVLVLVGAGLVAAFWFAYDSAVDVDDASEAMSFALLALGAVLFLAAIFMVAQDARDAVQVRRPSPDVPEAGGAGASPVAGLVGDIATAVDGRRPWAAFSAIALALVVLATVTAGALDISVGLGTTPTTTTTTTTTTSDPDGTSDSAVTTGDDQPSTDADEPGAQGP